MKLWVRIILILFTPWQSFGGETTLYQTALKSLDQGKVDEAHALLDQVPLDGPEFVLALEEIQKIHLIRKDYGKLFAYAAFLKDRMPETRSVRLASLEVVSLAQHCHFEQAFERIEEELAKKPRDLAELNEAKNYILLRQQFETLKRLSVRPSNPQPILSSTHHWRVSRTSLKHIEHPRILTLMVENRCLP